MSPPATFDLAAGRTLAVRTCAFIPLALLAACASSPMTRSGSLSSYSGLTPSNRASTNSQIRVDKEEVLAAKTVRISATRFGDGVGAGLTEENRALVANRVDRALCKTLSTRFDIVDVASPADLSIQATITRLDATNKVAAAGSMVVGFVSPIPIVTPRIPIGLGSLTVEAEALDAEGNQQAAMIWSRGAQMVSIGDSSSVSEIGDAYQLAAAFGENFGDLMTRGESPFKGSPVKLPTFGKKTDDACDAYGTEGGVAGFFADSFGMPPSMADKGAKPAAKPEAQPPVTTDR
ncbi:DUF3313 domain-containing protein [Caulobacter mirabilis]|uniref:DUF3313 domain-containing protein n=1 Tax=Caulobacter mirabilis TaxID=69666 RepID=A0A2D2B0A2_9CAUL|nr:DUF3313 domain-containing protein [Caulobacter mirabilis]ATQ43688.1 DUF3313 domain-containing protein [Caulobacter mirabilis]